MHVLKIAVRLFAADYHENVKYFECLFYGHFGRFKQVIDIINFVGRQNLVCGVTTDAEISVLYSH